MGSLRITLLLFALAVLLAQNSTPVMEGMDEPVHYNYVEFIHLTGPDGSQSLGDGIPRNGNYPTWAWSSGEKIIDQWSLTIPPTLKSGDYTIEIGFYQQANNQRMPALQSGQAAPDNSPVLLYFQIP